MLSNASLIFTRFSLSVLDHDFTDQDIKNIERIYTNMLMTTKSQEQQKALVKKYLGWVSRQPKERRAVVFFFIVVSGNFTSEEKKQTNKQIERLEHGVEGVTFRL